MSAVSKELVLSKEVASSTTESNTVVPASGKTIEVVHFMGHGAHTTNSVIKAVWDKDGTPEIIWSAKGDASDHIYFKATGDGIKKLALMLENGEDGALVMSGSIKYWEK